MAGQLELVQHVDLQRTKAPAERDLLVRRDALVAEHQHVVVKVRAMDTREIIGGQWLRQVQPDHFGTERRIERTDLETVGAATGCGIYGWLYGLRLVWPLLGMAVMAGSVMRWYEPCTVGNGDWRGQRTISLRLMRVAHIHVWTFATRTTETAISQPAACPRSAAPARAATGWPGPQYRAHRRAARSGR